MMLARPIFLYVFGRSSETDVKYEMDIYARLFKNAVGPNFIFIDDNARLHRAQLVDDFLKTEDIRRMDWPSRCPDPNPKENI
ncbi:hypothetical protein AVEN_46177-1 [Araneus ventricosus]|uniref:Tc1-like transposase DDE domain-containing protein n=1 Tax=Araneus ventricosus TaxID=182803 RepID=A0A4Y2E8L7_ARAVE|nr:hypothetical protein AVEN_46177-1 [Araneus ventricosus]